MAIATEWMHKMRPWRRQDLASWNARMVCYRCDVILGNSMWLAFPPRRLFTIIAWCWLRHRLWSQGGLLTSDLSVPGNYVSDGICSHWCVVCMQSGAKRGKAVQVGRLGEVFCPMRIVHVNVKTFCQVSEKKPRRNSHRFLRCTTQMQCQYEFAMMYSVQW